MQPPVQVHQKKPAKCKFCSWIEEGFTSLNAHIRTSHKEEYKRIMESRLDMEAKVRTFSEVVLEQEDRERWE